MPTPSDDTAYNESPLADISDARLGHTTCPPEEDREQHAPREERPQAAPQNAPNPEPVSALQMPTPEFSEADQDVGVAETTGTPETQHVISSKQQDTAEEPCAIEAPTPVSLQEEPKDNDARLAHSMSTAAISPSFSPTYMNFPSPERRHPPNTTSSFLRAGSKFHGTQQSDRQTYDVQVEIKHVDMEESFLCGYLRIQGLTDDHPTLTTFFEGEIIGTKHAFKTAHPEWGSTEKVDFQHWNRFPAWRPLARSAKSPNFFLHDYATRENLYMRWKEYFLVPDHKVKSITGASFEGFYYICFNQYSGTVSGIYFHSRSEKFQQLELTHVNDHGCVGAMEFR